MTTVSFIFNILTEGIPVGNGWYRVYKVLNVDSATNNAFLEIWPANSVPDIYYTGSGTVAWDLYGLQVESGIQLTSYIPTYGNQATRSADVSSSVATTRSADIVSLEDINFSSWFKPEEGSFIMESNNELLDRVDTSQRLFTLSDGTADNTIRPYINTSEGVVYFMSNGGGTATILSTSANVISGNSPFKVALAYKSGDHALSVNGSIQTSTNAALPLVFNKLDIARYSNQTPATCHIRKLAYYPKRLLNTELQALTK